MTLDLQVFGTSDRLDAVSVVFDVTVAGRKRSDEGNISGTHACHRRRHKGRAVGTAR